VRIGQFLDSLCLKENLISNDKVCVIIVRQDNSFVRNLVIFLAGEWNCGATQFDNKCVLVDDFVVTLSQLAVNFHAKTYELKNLFFVK